MSELAGRLHLLPTTLLARVIGSAYVPECATVALFAP
jgi:hypothetical protein